MENLRLTSESIGIGLITDKVSASSAELKSGVTQDHLSIKNVFNNINQFFQSSEGLIVIGGAQVVQGGFLWYAAATGMIVGGPVTITLAVAGGGILIAQGAVNQIKGSQGQSSEPLDIYEEILEGAPYSEMTGPLYDIIEVADIPNNPFEVITYIEAVSEFVGNLLNDDSDSGGGGGSW